MRQVPRPTSQFRACRRGARPDAAGAHPQPADAGTFHRRTPVRPGSFTRGTDRRRYAVDRAGAAFARAGVRRRARPAANARARDRLVADRVRNVSGRLLPRVVSTDLDLAVAETSFALEDVRLAVEPLPPHRGVFYCRAGHPLTRIGALTIDDIRRYPLAMSALPSRLGFLSVRNDGAPAEPLADGSIMPQIRAETPSLARSIVLESDALSLACRCRLRSVSPAAAAFIEILRQVEAEIG